MGGLKAGLELGGLILELSLFTTYQCCLFITIDGCLVSYKNTLSGAKMTRDGMSLMRVEGVVWWERLGEWMKRALNWKQKCFKGRRECLRRLHGLLLWAIGGHSRNATENSFGSVPVTHPIKSSPGILHVFIYVNNSRAVIIHELCPVWTFEAIKLVSSIFVTGMRNNILQHTQPD